VLDDAFISTGNLKTLAQSGADWARFGALAARVNRLRGYGDFLHYHLLARGALDVVFESDINVLDIAALTVIVREAGGTVSELDGSEIDLDSTTILATNGMLHAPMLAAMRR
jgi:histidinol-phosphatase